MREKKNENEDEAENEGPRTNRRGQVLMSSVEMGRRGGKEPKRVKSAAGGPVWHCLTPFEKISRANGNIPKSGTQCMTVQVV